MVDIVDLSLADVPGQNFENGAHHFLRINGLVVAKDVGDVIEEIALMPLLHGLSR